MVGCEVYAPVGSCCRDEDREVSGAFCPYHSMVWESYDCIIGDAPWWVIPFGRVCVVSGSIPQHGTEIIVEAVMSAPKRTAKSKGKPRASRGSLPAALSQLNLNAAGVDVGASSHFVAVPPDRAESSVREFEAFTADLYRLADWLAECGVETVVMESTGVYWIPLFGVLEDRGFAVMLVDFRCIKNVPGRKTDVMDCRWLQSCTPTGCCRELFVPRRQSGACGATCGGGPCWSSTPPHHTQHMQKALTQMNVKFQHVISDITGKTGMSIMEAIVRGERDPEKLAQLRRVGIKTDEATIAKSLHGH